MKRSSLIATIVMLAVSAVLIVSFIMPRFEAIRSTQDDIASYKSQVDNVAQVNAQLQTLVSEVNAISGTDRSALLRYVPDSIDTIAVLRTLQNIANLSGVATERLEYANSNPVTDRNLEAHTFDFYVSGSYQTIGNFLTLLEQNDYILEFSEVDIAVDEAGVLTVGGLLTTYSMLLDADSSAAVNPITN